MGITYSDVIALRFGEREFTTRDLSIATGSTRPAKLLSELKKRGLVERLDRGLYRLLRPAERPDIRNLEWGRIKDAINSAPWPHAWTDSTAIEIWTNGRYRISPSPFLRIFHLAIRKVDEERWRIYLKERGISVKGKKRIGALVTIVTKSRLIYTIKNGEKVVPREETIEIIRTHPGLYADAEDLIAD